MRQGVMRLLGMLNILLAGGLVALAMWLYGHEHATRQVERQIRALKHETRLEEETIRRLEIEWQRLRNPMRLQALAQLKLNLMPPDPTAVLPLGQVLSMLPLRPPPVEDEAISPRARDALSGMAARAGDGLPGSAEGGANAAADEPMAGQPMAEEPMAGQPRGVENAAGMDALGSLIRKVTPGEGGEQ